MSTETRPTTRREMRRLVLVLLLNVAIIGLIVFAVAAWFFAEEWTYDTVGDYDLDQGRFIKIVAEKSNRSSGVKLRYEVTRDGKVLLARDAEGSLLRTSAEQGEAVEARRFTIVPARRGDLVAVTDRVRQDDIIILHDFLTNQSWPAHGGDDEEGRAAGRAMLLALQREYPFFSCSALSAYRPRWVWSPKLTRWLVTYPDSPAAAKSAGPSHLAIRVFDTRTRVSCFVKTEFDSEDFDEKAAVGWMGNDVVVLAFGPDRVSAWKLNEEKLASSAMPVDEAVRGRAAELLASPRRGEQFAIPSPLLLMPEEAPSETKP